MITTKQFFGLWLDSIGRAIKRQILKAKRRSLYRLAEHFKWQQDNGIAGLRDTHKRIVMIESEIRGLK